MSGKKKLYSKWKWWLYASDGICIDGVMVHGCSRNAPWCQSNQSDLVLKTENTTTRLHNILNLFYLKSLPLPDHIELMSNLNDQITLCNGIILDNKDSLDFTRYRWRDDWFHLFYQIPPLTMRHGTYLHGWQDAEWITSLDFLTLLDPNVDYDTRLNVSLSHGMRDEKSLP